MKKREPLKFFLILTVTIVIFTLGLTIYINNENKVIDRSAIELELRSYNNLHFITAKIDNSEKHFLLDTGASESMIRLSDLADVNYTQLENGFFTMANGENVELERIMVDSICINNISVKDFTFAVIPSETENLLGKNFLNTFKKWTIDNKKNKLIVIK